MQFKPGERFLDLGCGCGIVGLVAASMSGLVHCIDHSAIAIATTRRTMAVNQITSAVILPSDCASVMRKTNTQFDVVATNPPFHQGLGVEYEVAQQFIRDASQVLVPGGQLYLVANRFIRYDALLAQQFAHVTTLYQDGRFRVIKAVR
jgi:16S rRNA (guanine1207-N2)-methyltransferase